MGTLFPNHVFAEGRVVSSRGLRVTITHYKFLLITNFRLYFNTSTIYPNIKCQYATFGRSSLPSDMLLFCCAQFLYDF